MRVIGTVFINIYLPLISGLRRGMWRSDSCEWFSTRANHSRCHPWQCTSVMCRLQHRYWQGMCLTHYVFVVQGLKGIYWLRFELRQSLAKCEGICSCFPRFSLLTTAPKERVLKLYFVPSYSQYGMVVITNLLDVCRKGICLVLFDIMIHRNTLLLHPTLSPFGSILVSVSVQTDISLWEYPHECCFSSLSGIIMWLGSNAWDI